MNSPERHDPQAAPPDRSGSADSVTGLERDCLRQAIHDLRGPLNTASIMLDIAMATAEDATLGKKLSVVVQELHRVVRMLETLHAASDSVASVLVPLDLGAAVAATASGSKASSQSVRLRFDPLLRKPHRITSCPLRLARALELILEACVATLPDGGEILFEATPDTTRLRLVLTASGPRVLPLTTGGKKLGLTEAGDRTGTWFLVRALIRGIGGDIEVEQRSELGARVALDLPMNPSHNR